jgi:hypothetical protein
MRDRKGATLLTSFTLVAVAIMGAPQYGKPADNVSDNTEIRNYRLTMDKIQKASAATEAINKLLAAQPALKKQMDNENENDKSLDQRAKDLDTKYPQCAAVIHSNGLATREYIVVTLAVVGDVMMVGMKKQGMLKEYPANSISPENAAFVEQNFDKISTLANKMIPPSSPK